MKKEQMLKLNDTIKNRFKDVELVLGDGYLNSKIILIGEAPGSKEIELGKPFVGKAGENLKEFLNILELDREDIYISNAVKFRPTKESKKTGGKINRPPTKKEIESFRELLLDEIKIINPTIIVTLGNTPLKVILRNETAKIGELHGELLKIKVRDKDYSLYPLYHPAAIIYRRELKKVYLEDLKELKHIIMCD